MHPDMSNQDKARLAEIDRHKALFRGRAINFQNTGEFKISVEYQMRIVSRDIERDKIYRDFYLNRNSRNATYWQRRLNLHENQKASLEAHLEDMGAPAQDPHIPHNHVEIDDHTIANITARVRAGKPDKRQDIAHNLIFKALLNDQYCPCKLSTNPHDPNYDPNRIAYDVVRSNLDSPLFRIRQQSDVDNLPEEHFTPSPDGSRIFLRDFMQIQGERNITVENFDINDLAITSEFANDFNILVNAINQRLNNNSLLRINKFANVGHRDAIQIIPNTHIISGTSIRADHFLGTVISDITIKNNTIRSLGALQGIFASDGAFKELVIDKNRIDTNGEHTITINGMLSGKIINNTDLNGNTLGIDEIKLYPLRIGGGANIFIIGFSNKPNTSNEKRYEYKPIGGSTHLTNLRESPQEINITGASFYDAVDMIELHKEYAKDDYIPIRERKEDSSSLYTILMNKLVANRHAVKVT